MGDKKPKKASSGRSDAHKAKLAQHQAERQAATDKDAAKRKDKK